MNRNQFVLNAMVVIFHYNFYNRMEYIKWASSNYCVLKGEYKKAFVGHPENISVYYNNKPILHKDGNFIWILPEYIPEFIDTKKLEFSSF